MMRPRREDTVIVSKPWCEPAELELCSARRREIMTVWNHAEELTIKI